MGSSTGGYSASKLVKFGWRQVSSLGPGDDDVRSLSTACAALDQRDLVTAYGPLAPVVGSNGNLSQRTGDGSGFVVTATQLPTKRDLRGADFVYVDDFDFSGVADSMGTADCRGPKLPSSESIMHWSFYREHSAVGAIVHVHEGTDLLYSAGSRASWARLGIVETRRGGGDGTLGLPESIREVLTDLRQYVVLRDHCPPWDRAHRGVLVMGETLEEALDRTLDVHERLMDCSREG